MVGANAPVELERLDTLAIEAFNADWSPAWKQMPTSTMIRVSEVDGHKLTKEGQQSQMITVAKYSDGTYQELSEVDGQYPHLSH